MRKWLFLLLLLANKAMTQPSRKVIDSLISRAEKLPYSNHDSLRKLSFAILEASKKTNYTLGLNRGNEFLGMYFAVFDDWTSSNLYLRPCMQYYDSMQMKSRSAFVRRIIARNLYRATDYDECFRLCTNYLNTTTANYSDSLDAVSRGTLYGGTILSCIRTNQLEEASHWLERLKIFCQRTNSHVAKAFYYEALFYYLVSLKRYQESIPALKSSFENFEAASPGNAQNYLSVYPMVKPFVELKQLDSARYYLDQSRALEQYPGQRLVMLNYEAMIDSAEGNFQEAFRIRGLRYDLYDSIRKEQRKGLDIVNKNLIGLYESERMAKDQQLVIARKNRTLLLLAAGAVLLGLFAFFVVKYYQYRAKFRALRQRQKIGEDLHDEVNPSLAYVKMVLANVKGQTNEADNALQKASTRIDQVIENVRHVALAIRESNFTGSVKEDLQAGISELAGEAGKQLHYSFSGDEDKLDYATRKELKNILMELVNNSIKHAHATELFIRVQVEKDLRVNYRDNGTGIGEDTTLHKGVGLTSIQSRVQDMQGSLMIINRPNGLEVQLLVPLEGGSSK